MHSLWQRGKRSRRATIFTGRNGHSQRQNPRNGLPFPEILSLDPQRQKTIRRETSRSVMAWNRSRTEAAPEPFISDSVNAELFFGPIFPPGKSRVYWWRHQCRQRKLSPPDFTAEIRSRCFRAGMQPIEKPRRGQRCSKLQATFPALHLVSRLGSGE